MFFHLKCFKTTAIHIKMCVPNRRAIHDTPAVAKGYDNENIWNFCTPVQKQTILNTSSPILSQSYIPEKCSCKEKQHIK